MRYREAKQTRTSQPKTIPLPFSQFQFLGFYRFRSFLPLLSEFRLEIVGKFRALQQREGEFFFSVWFLSVTESSPLSGFEMNLGGISFHLEMHTFHLPGLWDLSFCIFLGAFVCFSDPLTWSDPHTQSLIRSFLKGLILVDLLCKHSESHERLLHRRLRHMPGLLPGSSACRCTVRREHRSRF